MPPNLKTAIAAIQAFSPIERVQLLKILTQTVTTSDVKKDFQVIPQLELRVPSLWETIANDDTCIIFGRSPLSLERLAFFAVTLFKFFTAITPAGFILFRLDGR